MFCYRRTTESEFLEKYQLINNAMLLFPPTQDTMISVVHDFAVMRGINGSPTNAPSESDETQATNM